MRIQGFHIEGFGQFAGRTVGPLERPVTIFHGPNEAGKTTYLEFLRTVLFGFPARLGRRHYPALAGGRHGGNVTMADDSGKEYVVQRLQGRGIGPVTITGEAGETLDETVLAQLLGHHTKDVFQNVFAFTLDELHSQALLKDSSVNNQIYSAGMRLTRLPAARRTLKAEKDGLFLKGGRKHRIIRLARSLERIRSDLQKVEHNAAEYGDLTVGLEGVEAGIGDLQKRRRECQSRLEEQALLEAAWGHWNDLVTAERELSRMPVIEDFPVDGVSRLEGLEERVRTARQERDTAGRRLELARRKRAVEVPHEALLEHSAEVRRLERGRKAFHDSVRQLPERDEERRGLEKTFDETLKDLGSDWDESRLDEFDLSLGVREEISHHQNWIRQAREELARRESRLDQDEAALAESVEARVRAERALEAAPEPDLDPEQVRRRRTLVRRARSRLDQVSRVRQRVDDLQSQLEGLEGAAAKVGRRGREQGGRTSAALSAAAGIVLLLGGALVGGTPLLIAAGAGLALVGLAVHLYFSGASRSGTDLESSRLAVRVRELLREAQGELNQLRAGLAQDAGILDLDVVDEESIMAVGESLDVQESRSRDRGRLGEVVRDARDTVQRRSSTTDQSRKALEQARQALDTVRDSWREWLRARGLQDSFTPETAGELRGQIQLGRSQLGQLRRLRQHMKALRNDIREYAAVVEPLASAFGIGFDRNDPHALAAAADRLVELHGSVEQQVRDRKEAETEWEQAELRWEERERQLQDARGELTRLLRSGGADDGEDFRQRADLHRRRVELEGGVRAAEDRLQRLSGPGEQLEALKQALRDTDIQAITAEKRRIREEIERADADLGELSTQRGSIRERLERLGGEEESSKLRMERNRRLEQMRDHAREWVKRTLVERLLDEAQSRFERERQPGVVRHAEGFFRKVTGGRYRRVSAPLGQRTIIVTDGAGQRKSPDQLSRGAREQLFLSLRFGLIRELGQRTEPLPVIVDEVLVNFDPERALQAAHAFVELSRTNQVLVFTCHPTVLDLFHRAVSSAGEQDPDIVGFN